MDRRTLLRKIGIYPIAAILPATASGKEGKFDFKPIGHVVFEDDVFGIIDVGKRRTAQINETFALKRQIQALFILAGKKVKIKIEEIE